MSGGQVQFLPSLTRHIYLDRPLAFPSSHFLLDKIFKHLMHVRHCFKWNHDDNRNHFLGLLWEINGVIFQSARCVPGIELEKLCGSRNRNNDPYICEFLHISQSTVIIYFPLKPPCSNYIWCRTFSVPFYRWRDGMKLGTVHWLTCASCWRRLVLVGQIFCINT